MPTQRLTIRGLKAEVDALRETVALLRGSVSSLRLDFRGALVKVTVCEALILAQQAETVALSARLKALEDVPCACRPGRGQRATGGPQGR